MTEKFTGTYEFYNAEDLILSEFREQFKLCDLVTIHERLLIKDINLYNLMEQIREYLCKDRPGFSKPVILGISNNLMTLRTLSGENPIYVSFERTGDAPAIDTILDLQSEHAADNRNDTEIIICGTKENVECVASFLKERFTKTRAKIYWWYMAKNQAMSISVNLEDPPVIHDEYYPYIEEGTEEFFKGYLESNCPILLLSGDPGTGKTSFLRAMLYKHQLEAYIGYDMKLFESDSMFIELISGSGDVMILEDSENLVLPRKKENAMMTRFLNVSDGLIKFPRKKFIFTTNETDFKNNIDEALMRPGRCYATMNFRPLTYVEAEKACLIGGLPVPMYTEKKVYTLAELFNQKNKTVKPRSIGFTS